MSIKVESSGDKTVPVIIHKNVFNVGITFTESNYNVWSQIMEMHIVEREKLSYINGKKETLGHSALKACNCTVFIK